MIVDTEQPPLNNQSDIPYLSVSRLDAYQKCGEYYRLRYVEKVRTTEVTKSTLKGSLVHNAIEAYYNDPNWIGADLEGKYRQAIHETLLNQKLILPYEDHIVGALNEYSAALMQLYSKASGDYNGPDAIRTKDGKVPSNPTLTSQWKKLENQMNISDRKEPLDNLFAERGGLSFSICEAVVEARALCVKYRHPSEVSEVRHIEYPLSEVDSGCLINPVSLEPFGCSAIYLHGYIDLIGVCEEGLAVIDFKTSVKAPSPDEVTNHVQLLSYSWALEQLNPGTKVAKIGICHIKSGQLIWVNVPTYRDRILQEYFQLHKGISQGSFQKRRTECNNWYGQQCPYYNLCNTYT